MTEPTDAELLAEWDRVSHIADAGQRRLACLRAVLAKWGIPAPVGVEPVARLEIGKTKGGVSLTHIAEPSAFHLPEGMYALFTADQVLAMGGEPLTRQRLREAFYNDTACTLGGDVDLAEKVCRVVEKAHGIKQGGA